MKRLKTTLPAPVVAAGKIRKANASPAWLVIHGTLMSMKNRRRLGIGKNGKPFSRKNDAMLRYVSDFIAQVPPHLRNARMGSPTCPLRLICTVHYPNLRSDLDIALVLDCMQLAGIVANDRYIREQQLFAKVDAKNPRVLILLEEI